MNPQILFYTEEDGSVRMTIPNDWIVWRNVMNNIDAKTYLIESKRDILETPGIMIDSHYLQLRFANEAIAVQFKLTHL